MSPPFARFESPASPADRWYLGSPKRESGDECDPRDFTVGARVDVSGMLSVPMRRQGRPLDFTLADFDMPVVSSRLAECLLKNAMADIQLVPVAIDGAAQQHYILNVCSVLQCIAEPETQVVRWQPHDGRPEKVSTIRMLVNPVLTAEHHTGQAIFRVSDWKIMLLCTSTLGAQLLSGGFSGIELLPLPYRSDA